MDDSLTDSPRVDTAVPWWVLVRRRGPRLLTKRSGQIGLGLVAFVVLVAIVGPFVAPHASDQTVGPPAAGMTASAQLGTDAIGRDVLSRLLHGGVTVLGLAAASTALTYLVGLTVGLVAGYYRSVIDPILMRFVDLMLAFPALLLMLVLVTGAGSGVSVLILGVVLVTFPGVARLARTATQEASVRGWVEVAVARGEKGPTILRREVLPNIVPFLIADVGVRFSAAIVLIASLNFLGLGLRPPTADWGLMISENREIIGTNVWAVLAPAIMLGLLTVGVNLVGDAYSRTFGLSRRSP